MGEELLVQLVVLVVAELEELPIPACAWGVLPSELLLIVSLFFIKGNNHLNFSKPSGKLKSVAPEPLGRIP